MKKIKNFIIVFIFIFFISTNIYAEAVYHIDANIGFDGKVRVGYLNPCKVSIETGNQKFNGKLKLDTGTREYYESVNIPENTEKIYSFSIPISQKDSEILITLEEDNKVIEKEIKATQKFQKHTMVIGVLSDEPQKLKYLNQMSLRNLPDTNFSIVDLGNFLDLSLDELEAIDYIVIENYDTEKLPEEFGENLENWIKKGHSIFIGAGNYGQKTLSGMFKDLNIEDFIQLGYGNVIVLNENLESLPEGYMERQIEKYSTYLNYMSLNNSPNILDKINNSKNLFTLGELVLSPDYSFVCFLLSLIAVYFILMAIYTKREKGQVFGILILSFSTFFFILSFFICTGEKTIGEIEIDEYSQGRNSKFITYVNENQKKTNIGLKGDFLDNFGEENSMLCPLSKENSLLGKGNYHIYGEKFEETDVNSIKINIGEDDILTGDIENPLPSTMENTFLLLGDTVINIGTLKGKEKVHIEYKLDFNLKDQGDFNYLNEIFNRSGLKDEQKQLFEYYSNNFNSPYNCKLVGFSVGKDKIKIDDKNKKLKEYTMNVFDVAIEGETFYIPSGVLNPIAFYSGFIEDEIKRECTIEDGQELILLYPLPAEIDVSSIKMNMKVDSGSPELYVLNRIENSWEPLISKAFQDEYVDDYLNSGPLMLKVVGSSRISIPQIAVKGKYVTR